MPTTDKIPENGSYVTWRELTLWGKPFNAKIDAMAKSVESIAFMVEQLHISYAATKAIEKYKEKRGRDFWIRMGTIAALVGALAYIAAVNVH